MSGHSKWATIKRAKAATDAKRGNLFTKLANIITIAAKEGGGDSSSNFKLRLAIEKAKGVNMPKSNIERAIKRGTGELGGEAVEELTYGAILPGQISIIVKCLTDNKNRTFTDMKTAIGKNGGQLTDLNAVSWQFESKGVIKIKKSNIVNKAQEDLEMTIIESGAEDYKEDEDEIIIYTKPENLKVVKDNIEKNEINILSAELSMIAKEKKEVDDETLEKIVKILNALDEVDEVSDYYTSLA